MRDPEGRLAAATVIAQPAHGRLRRERDRERERVGSRQRFIQKRIAGDTKPAKREDLSGRRDREITFVNNTRGTAGGRGSCEL